MRTAPLAHRLLVITKGGATASGVGHASTTKSTPAPPPSAMGMPINPTTTTVPGAAAIHAPAPHPCAAAPGAKDRDTEERRACTSARKVGALRALVKTAIAADAGTERSHPNPRWHIQRHPAQPRRRRDHRDNEPAREIAPPPAKPPARPVIVCACRTRPRHSAAQQQQQPPRTLNSSRVASHPDTTVGPPAPPLGTTRGRRMGRGHEKKCHPV